MARYMGHEYTHAPTQVVQGRYRVGDRVRVVKDGFEAGGSYHAAKVGDVDEIVAIDTADDNPFEGKIWYYKEHEISPAFRPGDRVKLNRHSGFRACGERGTVSAVIGDNVSVRMDDMSAHGTVVAFFHADNLDWERVEDCVPVTHAHDCAGRKDEQGEPKFKAGDVVRCLRSYGNQFTKGETYTVRADWPGYGSVLVERDDNGSTSNGWVAENFALAPCPQDKEQPNNVETLTIKLGLDTTDFDNALAEFRAAHNQPCIVALISNGKPRPSTYPHVHESVEAATKEAERLARNNPGQEFAVYQRVAGRAAEVSVEMKEVA